MEDVGQRQSQEERLRQLFKHNHGYLKRTQAVADGIDPHLLSKWVADGKAERVQRGLYRETNMLPQSDESLIAIALRAPEAVVCLRSALAFHDLGTYIPWKVDLAIANKARAPTIRYPPTKFFYFTEKVYSFGVEEHTRGPAKVKVYSKEKTLADMLFYRNKLGIDLFIEGLQAYMRSPGARPATVMQASRVRRVQGLMRTYLEALT